MNSDRFKNIVKNYLDGKLSLDEKEQVDGWFDSITHQDISPFKNGRHRNKVKADILSGIRGHIYRKEPTASLFKRSILLPIAALIFLICTVGVLLFNTDRLTFWGSTNSSARSIDQVSTTTGEIKEYILPDSSSIWLSGNSRIRFDPKTYSQNRKIYLDHGEAFFDVQRDSLHPFTIETGGLSIHVLGTSFNIRNSKLTNQVKIEVKTGRVRVSDQQGKSRYILTKGKSIQYNVQNGTFRLFHSDSLNADIWTTGGIFLDNASFSELQELMFDRYGLSLRRDGLHTETFRYSILMPQIRSVEQLLNMICTIHQINYRRENDEIILYK